MASIIKQDLDSNSAGFVCVYKPEMGSSIVIFHQDPTHTNWQQMLDDTDYLTLDPVDFDMWDLLFDIVLLRVDDKLIAYVKDKYFTEFPDKADIMTNWLLQHKGKIIYHHSWTF